MTDQTPFKTLLITIGSTLFPGLTDLAVSPIFLDRLIQLGVEGLMVQYGKADLTLPPGVRVESAKNGDSTFIYPANGRGGAGISVKVLRYSDEFEELVKSSKWVISHAGTSPLYPNTLSRRTRI
jgi:beta-1,4-N-acetylglucosaminyltransferase